MKKQICLACWPWPARARLPLRFCGRTNKGPRPRSVVPGTEGTPAPLCPRRAGKRNERRIKVRFFPDHCGGQRAAFRGPPQGRLPLSVPPSPPSATDKGRASLWARRPVNLRPEIPKVPPGNIPASPKKRARMPLGPKHPLLSPVQCLSTSPLGARFRSPTCPHITVRLPDREPRSPLPLSPQVASAPAPKCPFHQEQGPPPAGPRVGLWIPPRSSPMVDRWAPTNERFPPSGSLSFSLHRTWTKGLRAVKTEQSPRQMIQ